MAEKPIRSGFTYRVKVISVHTNLFVPTKILALHHCDDFHLQCLAHKGVNLQFLLSVSHYTEHVTHYTEHVTCNITITNTPASISWRYCFIPELFIASLTHFEHVI